MKKTELLKDVEFLERKNQARKSNVKFLLMGANVMRLLGIFLIIMFITHLIVTHYLLLGLVSTLFFVEGMPISSALASSMSAQFMGLFFLSLLGLILLLLSRIMYRRRQELMK